MKRYPENGCIGEHISWQSPKLTCLILLCKKQIAAKLNQKSHASLVLSISIDNSPNPDEASYFAYPKSLQRCNVISPIHRANHIFPHLLHKNSGKFSCSLFLRQLTNRNIQQIGWQKPFHYFFSIYTVECITKKLSNLKQTSMLSNDGSTVCIKSLIYSFFKKEVFMFKKMLAIPILCMSMVFFVQCSKDLSDQKTDNYTEKKGPGSGGGGGGGHTEPVGNNLSFPVFAMDAFTITTIQETTFTVPYIGPYTGLSAEELAALEGYAWYAQKVVGNKWQAEIKPGSSPTEVTFIDWGDVLESVNPKINRPTRVEVTLYKDVSDDPMTGYTMALLAFPSSKNEIQGTNGETYSGIWATLASTKPALVIQYLANPEADLTWNETMWTGEGVGSPATGFGFAPELNVGGKYIFGASQGGWKPTVLGVYRITFYIPETGSNIDISSETIIANYPGNEPLPVITPLEGETGAAIPVVRGDLNLTYVDVLVVAGGGGGGGNQVP